MRSRMRRTVSLVVGLSCLLALALACGGSERVESEIAAEPTDQATEARGAATEMTLEQKLAAADLYDGIADKVVSRCASCNLAMQGSADHAVRIDEYQLHFCSEGCARPFEENPEQAFMAMALPAAPAASEEAAPRPES